MTLNEALKNGPVSVFFTKIDGTDRQMLCTQKVDLIPTEHQPHNTEYKQSSDVTRVYDLDVKGWRSFRNLSVKTWIEV